MEKHTTEPEIYKNHTPKHYDYKPYMKGKITTKEFIKELCFFCRVKYDKDILKKINQALHQGCSKYNQETLKAMGLLRKNGIEICLLSNALPILSDTGIKFAKPQYIFTSYNLGLLKPDIAIYQAIQQELNVPYNELLFIDDKEKNVTSAKSLGINGIIFNKNTILKEMMSYINQKNISFSNQR